MRLPVIFGLLLQFSHRLFIKGEIPKVRVSKLSRETRETQISVEVNLDGRGEYEIDTGNGMFDHLLAQVVSARAY